MKKILLLLVSSVLVLFVLTSCFGKKNEPPQTEEENKEYIYTADSTLYLVYDPEKLTEHQINLIYEMAVDARILIMAISKDSEPMEHEFVIGDVGREISNEAYVQLNRIDKNSDTDKRFCFYSSGTSLALAYDEDFSGSCLDAALDYMYENFIKDELILEKGVAYKTSLDVYGYLSEKDQAKYEQYWASVENALGVDGKRITEALKALYTIYDGEGITKWVANLYDSNICPCKSLYGEKTCSKTPYCGTGGFYFSNSGRDNLGFLPDVESTCQALGFIGGSGLANDVGGGYVSVLPEWMSKQIVDYVYNLQDKNGYFYHPQWGQDIGNSRRSRDLTWSLSILESYKVTPRYSTILNTNSYIDSSNPIPLPLGNSKILSVSKVIAAADETLIPDHLKTVEAFKEYLIGLNIPNDSYGGGSTLSAQADEIYARGPEFGKVLIEHLNECQYENGTWNKNLGYSAINGVMKISSSYSKWRAPIPNAEKTVLASFASIDTENKAYGIVDVWNAWVAATKVLENITNCSENGKEEAARIRASLMPNVDEAILATRQKLTAFLKNDGSFGYYSSGKTNGISMGQPVAVAGTNEGDLNATFLGSVNMVSTIFSFLNLSSHTVPLTLSKERHVLLETLNTLPEIKKSGTADLEVGGVIDFEDYSAGDEISELNQSGIGTKLAAEDPRGEGMVMQLISKAGGGDSITVKATGPIKDVIGMVYESDMVINSASVKDASLRLELGEGGDNTNSYRISFKFTSSGIEMYDCSSNTVSNRVINHLADLSYGQWFNLRVEVYNGDHNSFRSKIYLDGKLLAVSDNYFDNEGVKLNGVGTPITKTENARLYVLKDYAVDMMLDNINCYRNTEQIYVKEQLHDDYRFLEGALNVDNFLPEGILYDMEKIETAEDFPKELEADGEFKILSDNSGRYLSLSNGSTLTVHHTKKAQKVNYTNISFKIVPIEYKENEGVSLGFLSSSKQELFTLTFKTVSVGNELRFRLYDSENEISGIDLPCDKALNIRISHFEEVGIALIYVDDVLTASYKTSLNLPSFAKASFTAIGTANLDNISVEKDYGKIEDAINSENTKKVYNFDTDLGEITATGTGVKVSNGKLSFKGNRKYNSISVPVNARDIIGSYTEFGYSVKFTNLPEDGEIHTLSLNDASGHTIFRLSLSTDGENIFIFEKTANRTYANIASFNGLDDTKIRVGYYQNEDVYKIYINDCLVFVTDILYSSSSSELIPDNLTVETSLLSSSAVFDDMYADSFFKLYTKEYPSATPEDNSETVTFDPLGSDSLPSTLTGKIGTSAEEMKIIEVDKNGKYDKVLRFETKNESGIDYLLIDPTKTVEGAVSYVFECDFKLCSGSDQKLYQIYFWQNGKKTVEINIGYKNGSVVFTHHDPTVGTWPSISVATANQWFNIRLEYYTLTEGDNTSTRLKVFINDTLSYVTDINISTGESGSIDYVGISALMSADALIYLDNISLTGSDASYDGAPITEGFIKGNTTK